MRPSLVIGAVAVAVAAALLGGCGSAGSGNTRGPGPSVVLRLGYTRSLADSPAVVGFSAGSLPGVMVEPVPFASIPAEAAALEHGQLDAAYIDPVAAVAVWQSARGGLIRVISGAASGGAELVVGRRISSAGQLARAPLAAPAGGAQQAALDYWLQGNRAGRRGAGRITMTSAYLVAALRSGRIAGAWEPPPADVQLVAAGGHVLVNEASQWPGGQFTTSLLVVTRSYLVTHPSAVTALLKGQIQAISFLTASRAAAQVEIGNRLGISREVLSESLTQLTFTNDPLASSLLMEARHAAAVGLLRRLPESLTGMYDLGPLNTLLVAAGKRPVLGP
jgi:NitT/TauT family transport system substrate-binding protein